MPVGYNQEARLVVRTDSAVHLEQPCRVSSFAPNPLPLRVRLPSRPLVHTPREYLSFRISSLYTQKRRREFNYAIRRARYAEARPSWSLCELMLIKLMFINVKFLSAIVESFVMHRMENARSTGTLT